MTALLLLAGLLASGLVIARSINTVTGETQHENEARNLAAFLLLVLLAIAGGLAVFGIGGAS